jgi:hypothetical protein
VDSHLRPPQGSRIARTSKDLLLTIGVTLAALCLVELSLHLCGARFEASLFQMDPVRNYSFRPGATGWRTDENDVFVRVNKFGNRDRERSVHAAPGTLRIAVLGSSYTAALEVEQQETYTALLERELSRPGAPVEVLNFGVEGYGPAQFFYTLRNQVWSFHPQIVIAEVSLRICVLTSTRKMHPTGMSYPYFRLAGDSVIPDEASEEVARPTNEEISVSNHIRAALNSTDLILLTTSFKKEPELTLRSFAGLESAKRTAIADARLDPWNWTLVAPPVPEIEQGWQVLERLIRLMQSEAAAHGAEFWVIISNDPFQVNPDPTVAETLRREMGASTLTYGDDRFEHYLRAEHMNHIHLEPALLAYVQQTGSYLHGGVKRAPGEGHWNALGHRVVAQIVASELHRDSSVLQKWEGTMPDQLSMKEGPTSAQR